MVGVELPSGERVLATGFVSFRLYKFLLLCLVLSTFGYDVVLADGSINGVVKLGSVLRPSEQLTLWYSSEKKFGWGFHPSGNDGLYVLGIAYIDNKDTVLVWTAGGGIQIGVQSEFRLSNDGNLVLRDEIGRVLWQSNTGNSGVVSAALEDNGNFVLKNGNSSVVWDTFSNPTDTLLVGQELAVGRRLELYPYSFSLEPFGNLTLKWRGNITYWNVGASESSQTLTASLSKEGLFTISNSSVVRFLALKTYVPAQ